MKYKFKLKRKKRKYAEKGTAVGLSPEVYERLKEVAIETETRMQDLADMYITAGLVNTVFED